MQIYGKIIISERFLPFAQKSIPPAFYMGGHAGGEKVCYLYLVVILCYVGLLQCFIEEKIAIEENLVH
jgi:hypothetical protein